MQIHELNNFAGTPSSTDYLAIDNSTTTTKIGATGLGVQDKLTVAEANTGTSTASRIVTPKVVHDYVVQDTTHITSATKTKWAGITGNDGSIDDVADYLADRVYIVESGTSGMWNYRKWSDGTAECWGQKNQSVSATSWGTMYYIRLEADDYPAGLFTSVISAYGQHASDIDYVASLRNQGTGGATLSTTTPPSILAIRPTNPGAGATSTTGFWYVIGKWK